ncbi:MAG: ATP-binding protein [Acidobacteria bacterium]|nr:MAG: ATP-binding protein [Acidobacteriota bacterium]
MRTIRKDFVITNNLAEIDNLTREVLEFCRTNGISEEVCHDLWLATEEAVSNTIKYGYNDPQLHSIHLTASIEAAKIVLEIEDDAMSFNPLEAPDPNLSLPIEEKPVGGLGIYLIRSVMDLVEYERRAGKNILRMTKIYH